MKIKNHLTLLASVLLATECFTALGHDHLVVGAASNTIGAPLVFENDGTYGGDSGFFFNLTAGTTNDAYLGYYYTDDLVFTALAATPDFGGPEPGAAALGARIQAQLLKVEGPVGAQFGFWETSQDGVDSTNLTWSVPVPYSGGTNRIDVSENNGLPGSDPYGHIHGRIYSFTRPGLYKATWRFIDSSTNGPNGGPIQSPSAPFYLYYQADFTLNIASGTNGATIMFAAPSNIPDSGIGPATNYALESSSTVGPGAVWQQVGNVVVGDDHLHSIPMPATNSAAYYRLHSF